MNFRNMRVFLSHTIIVHGDDYSSPRRPTMRRLTLMEGQVDGGMLENPTLVHVRPIGWDFFDSIEKYTREMGASSPYIFTGAVLAALGARRSATMHLEPYRIWDAKKDWMDSRFVEEEVVLVPLQQGVGLDDDANEIIAAQGRFRHLYERNIPWTRRELDLYGDNEDKMMVRLIARLKQVVADQFVRADPSGTAEIPPRRLGRAQ